MKIIFQNFQNIRTDNFNLANSLVIPLMEFFFTEKELLQSNFSKIKTMKDIP